ncbi:MBL fold metallo-hydrolase [Pedobacter sp. JY14-1]|uniref:MBL fold metallo-hydrolase n=1 Tax=Pedobacter sp. JY14-1 TaxID=3034151 RepID=UPI0023E2197E|nr:MBL fold metallo-hydrolase [Pedobacter sp. JY14-1]
MDTVTLKVIGCGDAFGSGGRLNTCFFLKTPDSGMLMDCGASSLPGLKRYGILTDDVDTIVISHFHGDHYGGVPFVLLDAAIGGRQRKITVITPAGGREKIAALLELLYPGTPVIEKLDIDFMEYTAGIPLKSGALELLAFPMVHSAPALPHGLRIGIAGKTVAFSGDTSWTEELCPLSADADLFICECNFLDKVTKAHLSYREIEARFEGFRCKRMVLTHMDDEMIGSGDEIRIERLHDGLELEI